MTGAAPWHALLAPLPAEAVARRTPLANPAGSPAIDGWAQVVVELSAGAAGLRVVLVTLDADGRPVGASDAVLHRVAESGDVVWRHESLAGRFEEDGTFRGTRWLGTRPDDDEAQGPPPQPSVPGAADVAALRALVTDVLRRAR